MTLARDAGRSVQAAAVLHLLVLLLAGPATAGRPEPSRLEVVRARGVVVCGVAADSPGFSRVDQRGQWHGLEVEYCAAIAAAVLGKRDAVRFRALAPGERYKALLSGEIDVLARSETWTLGRESEMRLRFPGVLVYDGLALMVRRKQGVASVREMTGASICSWSGAPNGLQLVEYFARLRMRVQVVSFEKAEDARAAYEAARCQALAGDASGLAADRNRLSDPTEHIILPERLSKEPVAPAVRAGDDQWLAILRWTLNAMVAAEEAGITGGNVEVMKDAQSVEVRRLLGVEGDLGRHLGLASDWAYRLIRQVGNYGEVFDRTLGARSPLRMERGLNNLWSNGGVLYALPFR